MTDLCFMLAEFGREQYRTIARQMIESAKPWARPVQMSDPATAPLEGITAIVREDGCTPDTLMPSRLKMLNDYARHSSANIVMSDVDVIWQNDPGQLFDGKFDIGLAWRSGQPAMPYCGGAVLVRHGSEAAIEFLTNWWWMTTTLPAGFHKWWGDQISLAILVGRGKPNTIVNVDGCRVRLFDAGDLLFQVADDDQKAPATSYCRHYKGRFKGAMLALGE